MSTSIRVLIVDDDPQFRQLLRLVLRRASDIEIVGDADNGAKGVELAEQLRPDVVLLDLLMPGGMDGFEALPLIREAHPDADVIVLTALDADEASKEGYLMGAAAFVEKGNIADRLEPTIRTCTSAGGD